MSNVFYPLFALYFLSFCALIITSYSKKLMRYRLPSKLLTSLGFILVALISGMSSANLPLFWQLLPAFSLCFVGDYLLALTDDDGSKKLFLAGLGAFLLGHILFAVGFQSVSPFKWQELILPVAAVGLTTLLARLPHMGIGKMKNHVLAYSFFVTLLFSKGLSVFTLHQDTFGLLVLLGAGFFVISDGIILFLTFYTKKHRYVRFFNLLTYYLATLMLALSIYFYTV